MAQTSSPRARMCSGLEPVNGRLGSFCTWLPGETAVGRVTARASGAASEARACAVPALAAVREDDPRELRAVDAPVPAWLPVPEAVTRCRTAPPAATALPEEGRLLAAGAERAGAVGRVLPGSERCGAEACPLSASSCFTVRSTTFGTAGAPLRASDPGIWLSAATGKTAKADTAPASTTTPRRVRNRSLIPCPFPDGGCEVTHLATTSNRGPACSFR
jgi:hypothetical protein